MRIFLAFPKDVTNYREAAKRVAERLNEQHEVKLGSEHFLEVVDWNTHIAPLETLPEKAILEEIEVGENDIFLGIVWLGFDQQAADGDGSALSTERNFELALDHWKGERPDRCFLSRCMRLPDKLTDIDGRAFHRITAFFSRFSLDGDNPVNYYEFDSATDLEEHLVNELGGLVENLRGPTPEAEPETPAGGAEAQEEEEIEVSLPSEEETETATEFERRMEVCKAYEVSFLSIEITESEQITAARDDNPDGVVRLFRSFRKLVKTTSATYGGEIFSWNERGGLVLFWRSRSYDHAIMTGLKVLHNLPVFNLDHAQNPVAVSVKTRAAAHDAVIIFTRPVSSIESEDLDFVIQLQEKDTDPAEISITRRLLERIDERLKPHFKYKGRFDNEPIYICKLPSTDKVPSQSTVDDFTRRLKNQTSLAREVLSLPPSSLDITALETMSTAIDETYSILNKFCVAFSHVRSDWPMDFLSQLAAAVDDLTEEEVDTWRSLRRCYISGSFSAGKARKLEAIVRSASRRRSRPVVILEKLGQRCQQLLGSEEPAAAPTPAAEVGDDLIKKVDSFIRADALDSETILTDLLLNRKHPFLEYLGSAAAESRHQRLLDKLWQAADLVLLDDLYSIRGRQLADEEKVFDVLVAEPVSDPRFRSASCSRTARNRPVSTSRRSLPRRGSKTRRTTNWCGAAWSWVTP